MSTRFDSEIRRYAEELDRSAPSVHELLPCIAREAVESPTTTVIDIEIAGPVRSVIGPTPRRWRALLVAAAGVLLIPLSLWLVGRNGKDPEAVIVTDNTIAIVATTQPAVPSTLAVPSTPAAPTEEIETTGERVNLFACPDLDLAAGSPFYVQHGHTIFPDDADAIADGLLTFELTVDGMRLPLSPLQVVEDVEPTSSGESLSHTYVYNFPDGLEAGEHELLGVWKAPDGSIARHSCIIQFTSR